MDGKPPKTLHSTRLAVENEFYKIFRGLNQKTRPTAPHATFQRFSEKKKSPRYLHPSGCQLTYSVRTHIQTNKQTSGQTDRNFLGRRLYRLRRVGADLARRRRFARFAAGQTSLAGVDLRDHGLRPRCPRKSTPASLGLPSRLRRNHGKEKKQDLGLSLAHIYAAGHLRWL